MCGRAFLQSPPALIQAQLGTVGPLPNHPARYNLAPTQSLPVVRFNPATRERRLDLLRWGLVPLWARDLTIGAKAINARAEGIDTRPMFREAFAARRCLVPVDGFYEWQATPAGKQPVAIARADGALITLAGLWERWRGPGGEIVRSFTIVTTAANDQLRPLHERMPVLLDPADHAAWLGETSADPATLLALLRPCPDGVLRTWPVSRAVNDVRRDDPTLIEAAA